jgi:hypothetical protein
MVTWQFEQRRSATQERIAGVTKSHETIQKTTYI